MTPQTLLRYLPDPPQGYSYRTQQDSPRVLSVWLDHHYNYDYACGKPVSTIWGYIKGDKVYPATSSTKVSKSSVGRVTEMYNMSPYTATIPKVTSLLHL